MIKSMTGYGRGKFLNLGREYTVEIKTVNHRYNDISIRMPRYLNFLEDKLRQYISKTISRGKTEVYVSLVDMSDSGRTIKVDRQLAGMYIKEMKNLISEYDLPDDITVSSIMKLPDLIMANDETDEDVYWNELKASADLALKSLVATREREGERLKADILERIELVNNNVSMVEARSASLLDEYKKKLETRIKELQIDGMIDENRLGAEIVLFADKSSICEEITRLKSHIKSLKELLNVNGPIGKKLDFLIQEMNREVNTIGSKANCVDVTNYVVDTKNEIENIREQIQNIE